MRTRYDAIVIGTGESVNIHPTVAELILTVLGELTPLA